MPNFIVVAFYTKQTPYAEEVKGLQRTCDEHGIHCHIKGYRNRGKWVKNAAIKPEFLLDMMDIHPDKNIVYIDADARIKRYPELFDTMNADVGVHWRKRGGGRQELLSGTIFLSPAAKPLVRAWAEAQQLVPEKWDQHVLEEVLKRWPHPLKVVDLPPTYCQIFDSMKDSGQPVIEHLQASRRFKKLVEKGQNGLLRMPTVIDNARIRLDVHTGSYWLVRPNRHAEKWLDENCDRVPGELRWTTKFNTDNRVDEFRPAFNGKVCSIVGKGPSLDYLRKEHFNPDDPIIALNEAIRVVESLELTNDVFGLQQDAKLRATCLPKRAPIFVETKAANYYGIHERAYIFQNSELGLSRSALSVSAAVMLAKLLGARGFKLYCFDACVNKQLTYAKCIGYKSTWGGAPNRFLGHRGKIEKRTGDAPIEWVIPEALASEAVDRSQQ